MHASESDSESDMNGSVNERVRPFMNAFMSESAFEKIQIVTNEIMSIQVGYWGIRGLGGRSRLSLAM